MFPGGISDKLGNRYEQKWAVRCLLRVISGKAVSIRYEGISSEFRGFEFQLCLAEHFEWHQTKINAPNGNWTPNALGKEGVWKAFKARLSADPTSRCVFVSQDNSKQLRELCQEVRQANDVEEFLNASSSTARTTFQYLEKQWAVAASRVFRVAASLRVPNGVQSVFG